MVAAIFQGLCYQSLFILYIWIEGLPFWAHMIYKNFMEMKLIACVCGIHVILEN